MNLNLKLCTNCEEEKRMSLFSRCKNKGTLICNDCLKEMNCKPSEFTVVCSTDGCRNRIVVKELNKTYKCKNCI
jgi:hypothetical protein